MFKSRDFDLTIVAHTEPLDYDIYARPGYYFGYQSEAYAHLLEEVGRSRTPAELDAARERLQRLLAEDAVNVFLFELPKLGVWRKGVHGLWHDAPVQGTDVTGVWVEGGASTGAARHTFAPLIAGVLGTLVLGLGVLALRRHLTPRFVLGRIASFALTLLAASLVIFVLLEVLPGDPAEYMLGLNATPAALARLRTDFGLDAGPVHQYLEWLGGLVHGDLGRSYTYHVPVAGLLAERLAVSAPLALYALVLALLLAVPLGLGAALARARRTAGVLMGLAELGLAVPNFWLGNDSVLPAKDGAASSKNRSNFSMRNPKAMTAMAVRTQARNVRSFAAWSPKFLIMLPSLDPFALIVTDFQHCYTPRRKANRR